MIKKLTPEQKKIVWDYAESVNSFKPLVPYHDLLTIWQSKHPADTRRIATIGSHRCGNHLWCGEKCETIEGWIKKYEQVDSDGFSYAFYSGEESSDQIEPAPAVEKNDGAASIVFSDIPNQAAKNEEVKVTSPQKPRTVEEIIVAVLVKEDTYVPVTRLAFEAEVSVAEINAALGKMAADKKVIKYDGQESWAATATYKAQLKQGA